jgi:hypothetical protein
MRVDLAATEALVARYALMRTSLFVICAVIATSEASALTITYTSVAASGQTIGSETLTTINGDVTTNNLGQIAFTGTVTGPSGSGSALLFADKLGDSYDVSRISFPPSSRNYAFPQINDSGSVIVRELVPGAPPNSIIRRWSQTDSSIVASTTDGVFSSVTTPSMSNKGAVSYVGLSGASGK